MRVVPPPVPTILPRPRAAFLSDPFSVFFKMKFLEGIRFDVQHLPHRPGREAGAIRQHRHVDGQSQVETVFCIYYIIRLQLYIPTLCLYIRSSILTLQ